MANLHRLAAVFVGLMLSFAFAGVLSDKRAIDSAVSREATAIWDTFINLQFFGSEEVLEARSKFVEYTESIIEDEWSHARSIHAPNSSVLRILLISRLTLNTAWIGIQTSGSSRAHSGKPHFLKISRMED
jgi:hypothetical protein